MGLGSIMGAGRLREPNFFYAPGYRRRVNLCAEPIDVAFYDDFADGNYTDRWGLETPSYPMTETSGYVRQTTGTTVSGSQIRTIAPFYVDFPVKVEYSMYMDSGAGSHDGSVFLSGPLFTLFSYSASYGSQYNLFCGWAVAAQYGYTPSAGTWHSFELYGDEGIQTLWIDGVKRHTRNFYGVFPLTNLSINLQFYYVSAIKVSRVAAVRT
jgi:hypothetical protein